MGWARRECTKAGTGKCGVAGSEDQPVSFAAYATTNPVDSQQAGILFLPRPENTLRYGYVDVIGPKSDYANSGWVSAKEIT